MKEKILLAVALTIITITTSCNSNPLETPIALGRRDYVWTVDTIKAYYVYFSSIWGKTVNDVWMVSLVGSVFENIYRYDGTKWYRETRTAIGNTAFLWGTENNLWISTHEGRIWNYKKNTFTSSPQFKYEGVEIDFFSMAGKNDNEVYAGGGPRYIIYRKPSILYKYNGNNWQEDRVMKNNGNVIRIKYSSVNDKYYFQTYLDNETQSDTSRLYEYNGRELKIIYQNYISENTDCVINDINGYLYVTIGHKIFRYYKNNFEQILEVSASNFGGQTWGRNKNDIFIRMFDGLMHYNGTDLQYVLKFPEDVRFGTSALVLEKDVFLHAFDNKSGYNIIYHGKLK